MSRRARVVAPSNIAFVECWGARGLDRIVLVNASISMTLSACTTTTTVVFEVGSDEADRVAPLRDDHPPGRSRSGTTRLHGTSLLMRSPIVHVELGGSPVADKPKTGVARHALSRSAGG